MVAVKNNETTELLLYSGRASWIGGPITDVEKTGAKYPSVTWWWPAANLNMLYFNTQEAPFNNVAVRKAIAEALNTTVITDRAYYGAVGTANETCVLDGQLSQWVPPSVKALEWNYNPSAAVATLAKAGYKIVGGKLESPNGTALPNFNILVGSGWTDFISIAQTISEELTPLGITTTVVQEPYATYASSLGTAHYDMAISWGNDANATPYYLYYYLLSSKESAAPGKTANTNWERFSTPSVDAALNSYASTSNLAVQKQDMATIEKTILTQVPVVALTARPNWSNFSTKSFTGWPSAADPYNNSEAPDLYGGGAELVYLHVHLK
jgi:peptide/nickel transport system substrate-binding protein